MQIVTLFCCFLYYLQVICVLLHSPLRTNGTSLLYFFNYNSVSRQPIHTVELISAEPTCSLMLLQSQTATLDRTKEAMHRQMKFGIIAATTSIRFILFN